LEAAIARLAERLDERLDELEQTNATLRAEVATLRGAQTALTARSAEDPVKHSQAGRAGRTSRRTLLQMGGAAAAVGVAAMAASAAELAQPGVAHADGVAWQTGVVNSDNQTFVEPAGGSFPDPTLLTVRVGIAAPYAGLTIANSAAIAAYDTTVSGATGLYATSSAGTAVRGGANSGTGVHGSSVSGTGVDGESESYYGVFGDSVSYVGVQGSSSSGIGVRGQAGDLHDPGTGLGGVFGGGRAQLLLVPAVSSGAGAPSANTHNPGEIYVDSNATLWVCMTGGTPGTWVRLTSVANGTVGGSMNFLPGITRVVTSGNPFDPGVPLAAGIPQSFVLASHGGIPANATGVFGNATVYGSSGAGFVSVFPAGGTSSGGSLNFVASDEPLSNFVATGLGTGGAITVVAFASGCKFIYDAVGYTL
jgi:hypothetical protein